MKSGTERTKYQGRSRRAPHLRSMFCLMNVRQPFPSLLAAPFLGRFHPMTAAAAAARARAQGPVSSTPKLIAQDRATIAEQRGQSTLCPNFPVPTAPAQRCETGGVSSGVMAGVRPGALLSGPHHRDRQLAYYGTEY
jgi:hypothetical protein